MKVGVLLHVYHLETLGWEKLVWGDPAKDELGTLAKFADCLLDIPADDEVFSIIYSGPSEKDGLSEGAYTRQFLLGHIKHLAEFPYLKRKITALAPAEYEIFVNRLHGLVAGPKLPTAGSTYAEVESAARYFEEHGVRRVLQVAAASHGPRCIKLQAVVRAAGAIPKGQQWFLAVSDTCFNGSEPLDVSIVEPPHRADDPLLGIHPSMPDILTHFYYDLRGHYMRDALLKIDQVVADVLAEQNRQN